MMGLATVALEVIVRLPPRLQVVLEQQRWLPSQQLLPHVPADGVGQDLRQLWRALWPMAGVYLQEAQLWQSQGHLGYV